MGSHGLLYSVAVKQAASRAMVAALPSASILVLDPGGLAPFGPAKWAAVSTLVLALAACTLRRRSGLPRLPMLL